MPNLKPGLDTEKSDTGPDYTGLVRFLIEPLLNASESVSVDCEQLNNQQRIWIRLAVNADDKGRVYGRGGRNLKAIHTVLTTAATAASQSLYLDVYGGENAHVPNFHENHASRDVESNKVMKRRPSTPKHKNH